MLQNTNTNDLNSNEESSKSQIDQTSSDLYKKNVELIRKNNTLTILREIDEIILSDITNRELVAQKIANMLAKELECNAIGIYLLNKATKSLDQLATSDTEDVGKIKKQLGKDLYPEHIDLDKNTFVAEVIAKHAMKISHIYTEIFTDDSLAEIREELLKTQTTIDSSILYPLSFGQGIIGVMVISTQDIEHTLLQYEKELLDQLVSGVGIAINNALVYKQLQETSESLKKNVDELKSMNDLLVGRELKMIALKEEVKELKNKLGIQR